MRLEIRPDDWTGTTKDLVAWTCVVVAIVAAFLAGLMWL